MKRTQGKFLLFDISDFSNWLIALSLTRRIKRIQDHHTWKPSYSDFDGENHFKLLAGMERSHIQRGFSEIAQNLTIFPDGTVAVCRSFDKDPAGIKGANSGAICIENLGNFDVGADEMTEQQRNAITKVNALLCRKFDLKPDSKTIVYHHWFDLVSGKRTDGTGTTKSCPGTSFFGGNKVGDAEINFISLVSAELGVGPAFAKGRVRAEHLNVRAKPNAGSKKIKMIKKGTVITGFEVKDNWWRISESESLWVSGRFIDRIDE